MCVVSDEMYQVVVYMPEDVPFNCRVCCPERPSPWETVVKQEMYNGMKDVLDALESSHSSMLLQPVPQPVSNISREQGCPQDIKSQDRDETETVNL